jgi:HEAT repeat protein
MAVRLRLLVMLVPLVLGAEPPDARRLERLWADLAGTDAARAYQAICELAAYPREAAPFLGRRLRPAAPADPRRIESLLADLDSDTFDVRQKAVRELQTLGELAEPALHRLLRGKPSLDVRKHVERLLGKLNDPLTAPEKLRAVRAVEALERMGTPEARRVLQSLARGGPEARLTREAAASLGRLGGPAARLRPGAAAPFTTPCAPGPPRGT